MNEHWGKKEGAETNLIILQSQIQQIYKQSWIGLFGILFVATGVCIILWNVVSHTKILVWMGIFLVIGCARYSTLAAFQTRQPSENDIFQWADRHALGSVAVAVMWSFSVMILWPANHPTHQLLLGICITSISASAVALYSSWKPSYIPFLILPMPILVARLIIDSGLIFTVIGLLGILFVIILFKSGTMMHNAGENVLRTGNKNKKLNIILSQEKLRAEELNAQLTLEIMEHKESELRLQQKNQELEHLNKTLIATKNTLEKALGNVKQLRGLLPICASCKKIRNDEGYWEQIEEYIHTHSEAQFSHGICPECARRLYPEIYNKKNHQKSEEKRKDDQTIQQT